MSALIDAPRELVWRAVAEPAERIRWDERILSLEVTEPGYPQSGAARWLYQLGAVPVALEDRPSEVVPGKRLRHALRSGSFAFEKSFTLADEGEPRRTRLSLRFSAERNSVPVFGGALDRFDLRRLAAEMVDLDLRAVQRWCETRRRASAPAPPP